MKSIITIVVSQNKADPEWTKAYEDTSKDPTYIVIPDFDVDNVELL